MAVLMSGDRDHIEDTPAQIEFDGLVRPVRDSEHLLYTGYVPARDDGVRTAFEQGVAGDMIP